MKAMSHTKFQASEPNGFKKEFLGNFIMCFNAINQSHSFWTLRPSFEQI